MKRILTAALILTAAATTLVAGENRWDDNILITFSNATTWTVPVNATLERIICDPYYTNASYVVVDHYLMSGAITNDNIVSNYTDTGTAADSGDLEIHVQNGDQLRLTPSIVAADSNMNAVIQLRDDQL